MNCHLYYTILFYAVIFSSFCRAFVAPSDIQVFTSEAKIKLSARCQGKKDKCFTQAVKEICEAFEELQKEKSSGLGHNTDRSATVYEAPSVDGIEVDLKNGMGTSGPSGETWDAGVGDFSSKLEHCSHRRGETDSQDIKPSISGDADDGSSPVMSSEKKVKISNGAQPQKVLSSSSMDNVSYVKEEVSDEVNEDVNCMKNPGNGETALTNGHESKMVATGSKRKSEGAVIDYKNSGFEVTTLKDGKSGGCDLPDSSELLKDRIKGKFAPVGSRREVESDALKSDLETNSGKKVKELLKAKRSVAVPDGENLGNPTGKIFSKKKRLGKSELETTEALHRSKKSKHVDGGDDATKGSGPKTTKSVSPSSNVVDDKEVKQSTLCGKREILLALRAEVGKVKSDGSAQRAKFKSNLSSHSGKVKSDVSTQLGKVKSDTSAQTGKLKSNVSTKMGKVKSDVSAHTVKVKSDVSAQPGKDKCDVAAQMGKAISDVSGDEAILPLSKRRRRALEVMCDSATLNLDEKMEKSPLEPKNDSSSNNAKVPVTQLPKRRRAVCLYDDDEEGEEPKTPVHGGSGRNVKASSTVSDTSKRMDVHIGSSINQQHGISINAPPGVGDSTGFEPPNSKELSSPLPSHSLSPSQPKTVKRNDTHVFLSPGKSEPEQLLSDEVKPILASPKRSPQPLPATKLVVEQHKATKPLVKVSAVSSQKRAQSGSGKVSGQVSDSSHTSQNHIASQRSRLASSGERPKNTPKATSQMNDSAVLTETSAEHNPLPGEM